MEICSVFKLPSWCMGSRSVEDAMKNQRIVHFITVRAELEKAA